MHGMVQASKTIPPELIIKMFRQIIFAGDPTRNKFLLTGFPDIID